VAASAYARLEPLRDSVRRVVLLGPAHFVPVEGLAACRADVFETPLGEVPVDTAALDRLLELPQVQWVDAAHADEHSLEVHIPFLQTVLADFKLVPLLVGTASVEEVTEIVQLLWDGPETVFVVSSDLSHFHDYATARRLDRETSDVIEKLQVEQLKGTRACGFRPISGLLNAARRRGLRAEAVDLRNSGDTTGARDRVVGYGAYVVR
jgi:AmmeMemoRadiSam system protein B